MWVWGVGVEARFGGLGLGLGCRVESAFGGLVPVLEG